MHWILGQVPAKDRPTSTAGVAIYDPPRFRTARTHGKPTATSGTKPTVKTLTVPLGRISDAPETNSAVAGLPQPRVRELPVLQLLLRQTRKSAVRLLQPYSPNQSAR